MANARKRVWMKQSRPSLPIQNSAWPKGMAASFSEAAMPTDHLLRAFSRSRLLRRDDAEFTVQLLLRQLTRATDAFSFLARAFHGWLFVVLTKAHFTEHAFALQFLLQKAQGLINIVVTNKNLHALLPRVDLSILSGDTPYAEVGKCCNSDSRHSVTKLIQILCRSMIFIQMRPFGQSALMNFPIRNPPTPTVRHSRRARKV